MQLAVIITLVLLLCSGAGVLMLDARQRRLDRRVTMAMPQSHQESLPSVRRQHVESRWKLLQMLVDYRPGLAYDWGPRYVTPVGFVAAAAVIYANSFVGFPFMYVSFAAMIAAVMTIRHLFDWQRSHLANKLFRQLPDVVELMTSSVRSGLPVTEAFRIVARDMPQPTAAQFGIACSEMALGRSAEEAIDGIYRRTGVTEYGMFAVTLAVQMKSGGRLSETLQTLADTVRQRVTLAGRAKALAGEVIFSARALSFAPFIVGGGMYLINPQMVDLLFYDPTGRSLLAYAMGSVLVGVLAIRWMVRRETTI